MDSVLLVTSSEKSLSFFMDILSHNAVSEVVTAQNCGKARRLLIERVFDLCIINAPLPDEFGENFAVSVASMGMSQVILLVKSDVYDEVSSQVESNGVFVVSKPVSKSMLWSVLKLANAAFNRMSTLNKENNQLLQKIEDIRLIDRAKCLLIEYLSMTEAQAHKYIEKQAMDLRVTKKAVANRILKTYES